MDKSVHQNTSIISHKIDTILTYIEIIQLDIQSMKKTMDGIKSELEIVKNDIQIIKWRS